MLNQPAFLPYFEVLAGYCWRNVQSVALTAIAQEFGDSVTNERLHLFCSGATSGAHFPTSEEVIP